MTTPARFAGRARADIEDALNHLEESPAAGRRLRSVLAQAARLLGSRPAIGRRDLALADARYRFWSLKGFPYLLVYRPDTSPPSIVRVVHTAQDLPPLLADLRDPGDTPEE